MSSSHIKTAHDFGVHQALSQFGYGSVDDLVKEAQSIGLIDGEKTSMDRFYSTGLGTGLGGAAGTMLANALGMRGNSGILAALGGMGLGGGLGYALGDEPDPHAKLKAMAAGAGKGMLAGAVPGAIAGAALSDEDRLRGALKGGLLGGAIGGVGGGTLGGASHDRNELARDIDHLTTLHMLG